MQAGYLQSQSKEGIRMQEEGLYAGKPCVGLFCMIGNCVLSYKNAPRECVKAHSFSIIERQGVDGK